MTDHHVLLHRCDYTGDDEQRETTECGSFEDEPGDNMREGSYDEESVSAIDDEDDNRDSAIAIVNDDSIVVRRLRKALTRTERERDAAIEDLLEERDRARASSEAARSLGRLVDDALRDDGVAVDFARVENPRPEEDAPFARLRESLRRLLSAHAAALREADAVADDVRFLRRSLDEERRRGEESAAAAERLAARNERLESALRSQSREQRFLARALRRRLAAAAARRDAEDATRVAVRRHEERLRRTKTKSSSSSDDETVRTAASTASDSSSVSSLGSLVTDDGVATVRLEPRLGDDDGRRRCSYRLRFPTGKKIGLQLQKIPLNGDDNGVGRGLLSGMMSVVTGDDEHDNDDSIVARDGFVICGFDGFDDAANERPTLGARLVAIDDESLERGRRRLSYEQLKSIVGCKNRPFFTMTFRNDVLNPRQVEFLKRAVADANATTPPEDDMSSSKKSPVNVSAQERGTKSTIWKDEETIEGKLSMRSKNEEPRPTPVSLETGLLPFRTEVAGDRDKVKSNDYRREIIMRAPSTLKLDSISSRIMNLF